jgi:OOP family OmpA-OmpF porin
MNIRGILLGTALAIALPSVAMAEGFYVGAAGGVNWTRDADFNDLVLGASTKADYKAGGVVGLSAGYASAMGLRGEVEVDWRWRNKTDGFSNLAPGATMSGKTSSWAFMGNVLYDINTGTPFTPYIGAGAGIARVKSDVSSNFGYSFNDSDVVFAYQGIVGAAYNVTSNIAITADYRYFATTKPKYDGPFGTVESEYRNHTVMVGLRYSFGGFGPVSAPAAPAAPAAQQPQTEYLVFFDWDKANITPVSDKIIGDAAAAAGKLKAVSIHVIGHTDTSGKPAYNQKLSLRRADAVKKSLIAKGVPATQITVEGKGETNLLVPTGDNVREPSNRRAQILIRVK